MGSTIDLNLGCNTQAAIRNGYHSDIIYRTGSVWPGGYLGSLQKTEKYLQSMVEERRKVEGFKRELPICIQLLEDAIQAVKEELVNGKDTPALQLSCSTIDSEKERYTENRPTLEEFLPSKRRWGAAQQTEGSDGDTEEPPRGSKRPAWMAEAQIWAQNSASTEICHEGKEPEHLEQEQSSVTSSQLNLLAGSKERHTGAFLPFLRDQHDAMSAPLIRPTPRTVHSGAGLRLSFGEPSTSPNSSVAAASDSAAGSIDVGLQTPDVGRNGKDMGMASNGTSGAGSSSTKGISSNRKARRCWSPELHRWFVSALHQLGGAEVATPKQICELMKVDGLTNDEVKSHLQKYRLHTRRPSSSPQSPAGAQSPQLVVLGGIWMPPKYTSSASQPPTCVYDSSTGQCHPTQPAQLYHSAALPQDRYYACISNGTSEAPVMHRQPVFEPQQAASQSQSSHQEPLQVTSQLSAATQGPNSEVYHDESGEEEAKSDSTSWKNCRSSDRDCEMHDCKTIESCTSEPEKPNLNLPVIDNVESEAEIIPLEEEVNQAP